MVEMEYFNAPSENTRIIWNSVPLLENYSTLAIGVILEVTAIFGLAIWLLGYKLIKIVILISAFLLAGGAFYYFSPKIFHTSTCCDSNGKPEVHILLSLLVGFLGSVVARCVYRLGVFSLGFCAGMGIAMFIKTTFLNRYIENDMAKYGFYLAVSITCGALALWFEKVFVILTTSITGSLAVIFGIDFFAKTSFTETIFSLVTTTESAIMRDLINPESPEKHPQGHLSLSCIMLFVIWGVLALSGIYIQFVYTSQEINFKVLIMSCFGCKKSQEKDEPNDKTALIKGK